MQIQHPPWFVLLAISGLTLRSMLFFLGQNFLPSCRGDLVRHSLPDQQLLFASLPLCIGGSSSCWQAIYISWMTIFHSLFSPWTMWNVNGQCVIQSHGRTPFFSQILDANTFYWYSYVFLVGMSTSNLIFRCMYVQTAWFFRCMYVQIGFSTV